MFTSYLWERGCMCLHSCSNPCTGQSHIGLLRNLADSDTWAACGHSGNSCHHSNTGPSRDHWEELQMMDFFQPCRVIQMPVSMCVCFICLSMCLLTDGRQCGSGQLHAGAIVQRASIGTGADWSTGAQQTQPFTFLSVAGISH